MGGMMDLYEVARHHRELMLCEVVQSRLAKELRSSRQRRAGRASTLAWELTRIAGCLLKLLRASKNAD
jgi:hypothetical protein